MTAARRPLRWHSVLGAVVAFVLVGATLWVGGIGRVFDLVTQVHPIELAAAATAAGFSLVLRGFRLSLLLPPGTLRPQRAVPVAAVAQAAALFIPARFGELALPWLIRRDTDRDGASGLAVLLAARTLDTAALGGWAALAIIQRHGMAAPFALTAALGLLLPLVAVPAAVAAMDRFMRARSERWGDRARLWADRLHRTNLALEEVKQKPWRLIGAAAASIGSWALQWTLTWYLLAAMGFRWPAWDVVTGSAVASLSNLLPLNLVANLGTLEAGWTAAFTAMGITLETAAATGLACHVWALVFAAAFGAVAWLSFSPAGAKS